MDFDRFGILASTVPVDQQPFIGVRCLSDLLRESLVKVRQPGRRAQTRCSLAIVASPSTLPCVIRVWFVSQLSQDSQSLPLVLASRRTAGHGQDVDEAASGHAEIIAGILPSNRRRRAPAPCALTDHPICAGGACWRCYDRRGTLESWPGPVSRLQPSWRRWGSTPHCVSRRLPLL